MVQKIIPIKRLKLKGRKSIFYLYFKKPLNIILILILIIGTLMAVISYSFHPIVKSVYQQGGTYVVSSAGNVSPGFVIYPNVTMNVTFTLPSNATVFYNVYSIVTIGVSGSVAPGARKIIYTDYAMGTAYNGKVISVSGKNLAFPVSTTIMLISKTGGTYKVIVSSEITYKSKLNFEPFLAITGLALSTGSLIAIATVSGTKSEEL